MATVFLTYKLKPGVAREDYENWIRTKDYPTIRGIRRVAAMVNHRTVGLLLGEGAPSVDYIEVFDIPDLEGFVAEDMPGGVIQGIMGEFMGYVEDPEFIIAEAVV
ncbi:MAG TPA: hypothetical protein VEA44_09425 [Caulobacter sp.]|nr:hypothetical protein [Caulobacter sp.]